MTKNEKIVLVVAVLIGIMIGLWTVEIGVFPR